MNSPDLPPQPDDSWRIHAVADAAVRECDPVRQWLREHNWGANPEFMRRWQEPENDAQPLVLLAKIGSSVVGGLLAETQFAWLRISLMAVQSDYRARGIGGALLAEAERLAKIRRCRHVYVDTMEYQAPRFYLAHGFKMAGEIPDWDSHGHAKYYLTKQLDELPKNL